jgi:hypothetical protein
VLSDRHVVVVLGPHGVGKTEVAQRLAEVDARQLVTLGHEQIHEAIVNRIAKRKWPDRLIEPPALLLDGPVWLKNRPAAVQALCELLRARAAAAKRTLVCQADEEGSCDAVIGEMESGSTVVIGLRFPKGPRGRLRFARRVCDELDLPRVVAKGTEDLDPWGYAEVIRRLKEHTKVSRRATG